MNLLARVPASARAWRMLLGLAVFQAAWFACVALAARDQAAAGIAAVAAVVLLHLAFSDKPGSDTALIAAAVALGLAWDSLALGAHWLAALFEAVGGPFSYAAAARMEAAR